MKNQGTAVAFGVATVGIALFSGMDGLMKYLSLEIGTYDALLWRTGTGALIAALFFFGYRSAWPTAGTLKVHLTRGLISVPMALLFFWGLARVPMAQAIALAFVAPLIALYLAALLLGEQIDRRAILASLLGLGGVLVIFAGQAEADLGPDAFRGSLAILASAGLYAYNIILMRRQALLARPVEVAFFTTGIMAVCFILAIPLVASVSPNFRVDVPEFGYFPYILAAALLAFASLLLLSWAYARAEAQHLAPVEYTSIIWATILGAIYFDEAVEPLTFAGAAMIIVACLITASRRSRPSPVVEAGVHA